MADANIKGVVHYLSTVEHVGQKNMPKRTLVIETEGRYPQYIPIEASGDKVKKFDNLKVGQEVTASVFINGRAGSGNYEGKYFSSLEIASFPSIGQWPANQQRVQQQHNQQAQGQPQPFTQPQQDEEVPY